MDTGKMNAEDLINVKVYIIKDGRMELRQSRLYYHFQSAMQDVIDGSCELFESIPKEYLPEKFNQPEIRYGGIVPETGRPTDFDFRYPRMVVWIGTVIIEDKTRK